MATDAGGSPFTLSRHYTRRGARRAKRRHLEHGRRVYGRWAAPNGIFEPIPGKPLYRLTVEREP